MTKIPSFILTLFAMTGGPAIAANLMLDFGPTAVDAENTTLSPGHHSGQVPGSQTSWNTITSTAGSSSLIYGNGSSATGVSLHMGQESTAGNNVINFSTAIGTTTLAGSGGAIAGQQKLTTNNSIYGSPIPDTSPVQFTNTVARDGFFGGTGAAIGLRLDGLVAGEYLVYVMARNTNSNATSSPMNVYANALANSGTFAFGSLSAFSQSNTGYASSEYTDQYTQFTEGQNYVAINVVVAAGQSLYVAIDGSGSELRGFLNMVQIVQIPEPSTAILGAAGFLFVFRRRRKNRRSECYRLSPRFACVPGRLSGRPGIASRQCRGIISDAEFQTAFSPKTL